MKINRNFFDKIHQYKNNKKSNDDSSSLNREGTHNGISSNTSAHPLRAFFYRIGQKFLNDKKDNDRIYILSFFIPVCILLGLYYFRGIFPFGNNAYLVRDMYHQYAPFFSEFSDKLKNGENLTYSWNIGMGINFTALYAYYLASPINWILFLIPKDYIIEIMNVIIIFKIGLSGWAFTYYVSKHFKHKDTNIVVFSTFYALSSYIAAYAWNIMWLDCLVLLPIIVLGLERLVKEKKYIIYCISLSLAILSNYYIGFMLCIFSFVYFIYLLFSDISLKGVKSYFNRIYYFGLYSLIAGFLSAFLLIPEFYALKMSGSGQMNFPSTLERYFSILEMFSRALIDVPVSTALTHEPNLYSSLVVFLLIPLYWFNQAIRRREKVGKAIILFFFLLSFNLNIPDYIWHGFHFPNSLPCRQSFIFIFLILEMSYEAFRGIKVYTEKQIYGTFAGVIGLFLLFDYFIAGDNYDFSIIYISMAIVALYLFIFMFYRKYKSKLLLSKIAILLFLIVAITETITNTDSTGFDIINRTDYISDNSSIDKLLEQVKEKDTDFYRIEKYTRRTKNDAAWNQYHGVSIFSSTTNAPLNSYLRSLGFQSSMNAYSFSGNTPLTASLLSVKYMLGNEQQEDSDLTKLYTTEDGHYLYQNNYTLPFGFMLASNFENTWNNNYSDAFQVQNNFVKTVLSTMNENSDTTDSGTDLNTDSKTDLGNSDVSSNNLRTKDLFEKVDVNVNEKVVTIPVDTEGNYYMYTTTDAVNSIEITILSASGTPISKKNIDDLKTKYIVNLGTAKPGCTIQITTMDEVEALYLYAYRMNDDVFKNVYDTLNKQPFIIESYDDTHMKGSINASQKGIMYTSIPYENGWKAVVDGKKVDTIAFKDALVAIPLTKGQHTIEFSYAPQGFTAGIVISVVTLLGLLILVMLDYYHKNKETNL